MLYALPFLAWLAAITSAVLLTVLWSLGELRRGTLAILLALFLVAVYCQFRAWSPTMAAAGLALQTLLAVGLLLRWRLT